MSRPPVQEWFEGIGSPQALWQPVPDVDVFALGTDQRVYLGLNAQARQFSVPEVEALADALRSAAAWLAVCS